jgi:hypothetical protein
VQTLVGQTVVNNVGIVTGTDGPRTVTASDPASTVLTAPPVVPPPPNVAQGDVAPVVSTVAAVSTGSARLSGPTRCVSGPFMARVTGKGIAKVVFMLDAKKVKTITNTKGASVLTARILPRGNRKKAHRVSAIVTFKASAHTASRTLRFVYLGCARRAAAPKFTG